MKLKSLILAVAILFSITATKAQTVNVKKLPTSVDEFLKLRKEISKTPEGGATLFLVALKIYTQNPELGHKCFVIAVDRGALREGDVYKGFDILRYDMRLIKDQMAKNNKIPNSYIQGTSPDNNYTTNAPFTYKFKSNPSSGDLSKGIYKKFVFCTGADSPRPMTMKKNDKGYWKVSSWSSVLVGVKKPAVIDDL